MIKEILNSVLLLTYKAVKYATLVVLIVSVLTGVGILVRDYQKIADYAFKSVTEPAAYLHDRFQEWQNDVYNRLTTHKVIIPAKEIETLDKDLLKNMHDSVVKIRFVSNKRESCEDDQVSCGTGVVIYADENKSYILTNKHIAGASTKCGQRVSHRNFYRPIEGKTVAVSDYSDLAIVRVNKTLTPIDLAEDGLAIGEKSIVIGQPKCRSWLMDDGYTAKKNLNILGQWAHKTNTHTFPGNSGSPVYNYAGKITGLIFAGDRSFPNFGFYQPLEKIKSFLNSVGFPNIKEKDYLAAEQDDEIIIEIPGVRENSLYYPIFHENIKETK